MNPTEPDNLLGWRQTTDGRTVVEHDWSTDARSGRAIQDVLTEHVDTTCSLPDSIQRIAGVDIGFEDRGATTRAAIVVMDPEDLSVQDSVLVREPTRMPYVPGLLSFREIPAALVALERLATLPDLLMVDGHGIAHPRRLGVATHLGLACGLPTIGVAKKRLTGQYEDVPDERLAWTPLLDGSDTIGAVLRSRVRVKPIFISPGHRIDLGTAIDWTARTLTRYRLPETTRAADRLASDRDRRRAAAARN